MEDKKKFLSGRLSFLALLLCALLFISLFGYHVVYSSDGNAEADSVKLYYLNADEDGFVEVSYKLKNPENSLAASKEVIHRLSDTEESNTDKYKASVFDSVAINEVTLENGIEKIDFDLAYTQLDDVREALMRTAIVKTVLQIKGVKSVSFSVNGSSLQGTDKSPVGVMDSESILTDDSNADIYNSKRKVKLYYVDKTGKKLVACERTIEMTDNIPVETQVLLALKKVPSSKKNLISPLPEGVEVNQTQVFNNICYVDLSSQIENPAADVKAKITVYAMVNTLAEIDSAYQIQFTVDGEKVSELNEFKNFDMLLTSDYSLTK